MKKSILILFVSLFQSYLNAQEYAEFRTDTTFLKKSGKNMTERILNQVFFFNGQEMRYGSGTIKVEVTPNKLDTILFKKSEDAPFDTIICNVSEPKKYVLHYNHCCGAFNIHEEGKGMIKGKIIYKLTNSSDHIYLGTIAETGMIIKSKNKDAFYSECSSAMSPNVCKIAIMEIGACHDSSICIYNTCLKEPGTEEPDWNFEFSVLSKKMEMFYMPLNSEPLIITFNPETDEIKIK